MSAICGVVGLDGRPWSVDALDGMIRALAPLGRDGSGNWAGPAGRCGVAIASVLQHATPEDAADRQPARNKDGSIILVGDLRIDNRAELAGLLKLGNDEATPDSEFMIAAYERWGEHFLDRIVGELALAIVDMRRGGVLLARDAVGARPLCIHQRRDVVAFASMPLALTAFEGVGHRLDVEHAAEILALAYSSERTFVEGVLWLGPATALWIDDAGIRRRKWWDPDPHEIVDLGSPAAYEGELREAFDLAVAARLRSSGAVGATVSGGLDSSSAAATAAQLLAPEHLPTFTSAPPPGWHAGERPGWDADETPLVKALAEMHRNMIPTFVHVPHDAAFLTLQEPLWESGAGPALNPCNMVWLHAIRARASEAGINSLLSGDFGNIFFSADGPQWLASHLRAGRVVTALREASTWRKSSGDGWPLTLRRHVAAHVLPMPLLPLARKTMRQPEPREFWFSATALRPEIAASLDLQTLSPMLDDRLRRDERAVALFMLVHRAGHADSDSALAAVTGVETRDPTIDRRVLEVSMRQPEWARRRDGITRAVARGAMSDRLPRAIIERTRRGEQLPDWLDLITAARKEIMDELEELEGHGASRHLIDVARLRRLLNRWPERSSRAEGAVVMDYRLALLRALVISRYMRWFERHRGATAN